MKGCLCLLWITFFASSALAQSVPSGQNLAEKRSALNANLANLAFTKNAIRQVEMQTVEAAEQQHCLASFNHYAEQIRLVLAEANGPKEGSLLARTTALSTAQKAYADRLEEAIKSAQLLPVDSSSVGQSVEKLRTMLGLHAPEEGEMVVQEQGVLVALSRHIGFLNSYKVLLGQLHNCSSQAKDIATLDALAKAWTQKWGNLYNVTSNAYAKRLKLQDTLRITLERWLLKQSSQAVVVALNQLTTQMEDAFKADRFLYKVALWWGEAYLGRGPGRGAERFYHMHRGTLRNLQADVVRADELLQEAEGLKLEGRIAPTVLNTILGHRKFLTDDITRLEQQGWQKSYQTQLAFLDSYAKRFDSPVCRVQILKQRNNLQRVKGAEDFAFYEAGFVDVYHACIKSLTRVSELPHI